MRSKIIETTTGGLWLKVMVAVLDEEELHHPSALPYNQQHFPESHCSNLERQTTRDHIWILDLSTGEGAAFLPTCNPEWDTQKVSANL